jgi:hypothetical protein
MEAAMEAAAWMEAAVIVAAREAVLVAETADAATVTVLADISGLWVQSADGGGQARAARGRRAQLRRARRRRGIVAVR